ncbi:hypothetical protein EDB87DRAFT_197843 [Lactarius vividus]|nr:hypothetical protein EDB87DRAFT_197843 [Lactarius vividus]
MRSAVPPPVASIHSQCSLSPSSAHREESDGNSRNLNATSPSLSRHRLCDIVFYGFDHGYRLPYMLAGSSNSAAVRALLASCHLHTSVRAQVPCPIQPAPSLCSTVSPSIPMSYYIRSWFTFCCFQHMVTSSSHLRHSKAHALALFTPCASIDPHPPLAPRRFFMTSRLLMMSRFFFYIYEFPEKLFTRMYRGHNDANLALLYDELKKLFYHYDEISDV